MMAHYIELPSAARQLTSMLSIDCDCSLSTLVLQNSSLLEFTK